MSNRPLSLQDTGRQSPFRRQNSASPATIKAATPTSSPTKTSWSPTKTASLSPEKASPFVRRPSQINGNGNGRSASERPVSPFARPGSNLGVSFGSGSPSRNVSEASSRIKSGSGSEEVVMMPSSPRLLPSPSRRVSPAMAIEEDDITRTPAPSSPAIPHSLLNSPSPFDGPALDSPPTFMPFRPTQQGDSSSIPSHLPSQANLRPTAQRTITSSTATTIKAPSTLPPPIFNPTPTRPKPASRLTNAVGGYTHVPQPLLRSMRESFEVIDSTNTGSLTSTSVASMLEQMGMPSDGSSLRDFFPPNGPSQLNLARYLDTLSAPMAELSHPDELAAAFEAFDIDDSGQIDVNELRNAVLNTAPEPGEDMVRLSEREVDSILGEFASRRAFGAKGVNVAKGKGEVFRYKDFMAGIAGGSTDAGMGDAGAGAMAV
ncbi:hypothetical protein LTR85_002712 [Meristemomyces frigidus]|nr:hypothetical protein LTR85_002712 [Meristemomyces frigidus]